MINNFNKFNSNQILNTYIEYLKENKKENIKYFDINLYEILNNLNYNFQKNKNLLTNFNLSFDNRLDQFFCFIQFIINLHKEIINIFNNIDKNILFIQRIIRKFNYNIITNIKKYQFYENIYDLNDKKILYYKFLLTKYLCNVFRNYNNYFDNIIKISTNYDFLKQYNNDDFNIPVDLKSFYFILLKINTISNNLLLNNEVLDLFTEVIKINIKKKSYIVEIYNKCLNYLNSIEIYFDNKKFLNYIVLIFQHNDVNLIIITNKNQKKKINIATIKLNIILSLLILKFKKLLLRHFYKNEKFKISYSFLLNIICNIFNIEIYITKPFEDSRKIAFNIDLIVDHYKILSIIDSFINFDFKTIKNMKIINNNQFVKLFKKKDEYKENINKQNYSIKC